MRWLQQIKTADATIKTYQHQLIDLVKRLTEDKSVFAWLALIQALKAVNQGNFGVGVVTVDSEGVLQAYDHNHVLVPHFRSDQYA